jgi:hypothetical protein
MTSPTNDNYTEEKLARIEWFKNAGPALREDMIRTYEVILPRNKSRRFVVVYGMLLEIGRKRLHKHFPEALSLSKGATGIIC